MHLQISCLGAMEDLTDVVDWALDALNPLGVHLSPLGWDTGPFDR
jgi:hypothetical protein